MITDFCDVSKLANSNRSANSLQVKCYDELKRADGAKIRKQLNDAMYIAWHLYILNQVMSVVAVAAACHHMPVVPTYIFNTSLGINSDYLPEQQTWAFLCSGHPDCSV
jgi:hypothetical protein